ncbi:hypothetical protein FRC03_005240 [Tulasnella sp. 419]|nr:hypothetical protein FRC03_005240 [Tulasnella sp. 419]
MSATSDRDVLLSMGFPPERVDWAIQETASAPDLQRRIEHIIEHEDMIPPKAADASTNSSAETAKISPLGNRQRKQESNKADSLYHADSNISSSNITLNGVARNLEERYMSSLERFASFLQYEQDLMHGALLDDKETSLKALEALETFFKDEIERRRIEYQLPSVSNQLSSVTPSTDARQSTNGGSTISRGTRDYHVPVASSSQAPPDQDSARDDRQSTISVTRPSIPASSDIKGILSNIYSHTAANPIVQQASNAAEALRPQLAEWVQSLRIEYDAKQLPESQVADVQEQRRREAHSAHLSALYQAGQMSTAAEVTKKFEASENAKKLAWKRTELENWKKGVSEVGREGTMATLQKLQVELKRIADVLEEDEEDNDVVNATRALLQVSDLMENEAVVTLESLEDDLSQREHDFQCQSISLSSSNIDAWKEIDRLEKAHELAKLELGVIRCDYKIKRTAPCHQLILRQLQSHLKRVNADEALLSDTLLSVLSTVPPFLSLEEEELKLAEGDGSYMTSALPSIELIDQIRAAHAALSRLNSLASELSSCVQVILTRQAVAAKDKAVKEVILSEFRAGRGDQVWLSEAFKSVNEQHDQMIATSEEAASKEKINREKRWAKASEKALDVIRRHEKRSRALKQKTSENAQDSTSGLTDSFARLLQQQQQTQMVSNMMWSQHASRMAVIDNIGSGSTQWVVNYR